MHEQNTPKAVKKLKISGEVEFVKKCMEDYGYSVLKL